MTDEQLVPYYLMSCYLYYQKNSQVLEDKEFDVLCYRLLEKWDEIKHPHKHLILKDNLEAQTGYNCKFPNIVKISALEWLEESSKPQSMLDFFS